MQCHAEIVQVENALTHATSYLAHAAAIDKISLYESRLNRVIVRNTELLTNARPTAATASPARRCPSPDSRTPNPDRFRCSPTK